MMPLFEDSFGHDSFQMFHIRTVATSSSTYSHSHHTCVRRRHRPPIWLRTLEAHARLTQIVCTMHLERLNRRTHTQFHWLRDVFARAHRSVCRRFRNYAHIIFSARRASQTVFIFWSIFVSIAFDWPTWAHRCIGGFSCEWVFVFSV